MTRAELREAMLELAEEFLAEHPASRINEHGDLPEFVEFADSAWITTLFGRTCDFDLDFDPNDEVDRLVDRICWRSPWTLEFLLQAVKLHWENKVNPRRQSRPRRELTAKQRRDTWDRSRRACAFCHTTEGLVIDHIYPVSKGGTNDALNLQILCCSCNSRKGTLPNKQVRDEVRGVCP